MLAVDPFYGWGWSRGGTSIAEVPVRQVARYDFDGRAGAHNVVLAPGEPVNTAEGWPQPPAHAGLLTRYAEIRSAERE